MRTLVVASFFAVVLASAGCVTGGSPHDLAFNSVGHQRSVRVEDDRVWGAKIELDRYDGNSYRGSWLGKTVDVRFQGADRVQGTIGSVPVDLHVAESGDALGVQGLVGSSLGHVELTDEKFTGSYGACGYDLHRVQGTNMYKGMRCGSATAELQLPEGWNDRQPQERAMLIAFLFAAS